MKNNEEHLIRKVRYIRMLENSEVDVVWMVCVLSRMSQLFSNLCVLNFVEPMGESLFNQFEGQMLRGRGRGRSGPVGTGEKAA